MIYLACFDWTREWFPAWIVVIVLAREFLVTGIRGYIESLGLALPADWFGKVKMLLQCIAISVVLGMLRLGVHIAVLGTWRTCSSTARCSTPSARASPTCSRRKRLLTEGRAVNKLKLAIVSCGFLGLSPVSPGTAGTLGGVALAWGLASPAAAYPLCTPARRGALRRRPLARRVVRALRRPARTRASSCSTRSSGT
jgi:phosphatidylglycerophosphate synthase